MRLELTEELARAIGWDAANVHAAKHGRKTWNQDDYSVAVREFARLIPHLPLEARMRLTGNVEGITDEVKP